MGRPVATLVDLDGRACDGRREAALAGRGERPRWFIDGHAQVSSKGMLGEFPPRK
jgi:hypothetical protein